MPQNAPNSGSISDSKTSVKLEKAIRRFGTDLSSNQLEISDTDLDWIILESEHLSGFNQARVLDALYETFFTENGSNSTINGSKIFVKNFDDYLKERVLARIIAKSTSIPERTDEYISKAIDQLFDTLPPANQDMFDELQLLDFDNSEKLKADLLAQDNRFTNLFLEIKLAAMKHEQENSVPRFYEDVLQALQTKLEKVKAPTPMISNLKLDLQLQIDSLQPNRSLVPKKLAIEL